MTKFDLEQTLLADYNRSWSRDGVSGERIAFRLGELSKIGLTAKFGVTRVGFSPLEQQAKELVMGWMREAGMTVTQDGAGNVVGRIAGKQNQSDSIASGSHVDSVPEGGHFDGPLGVIAALEVAEAWKEQGVTPNKPYEVYIFTDEEGTRFNGGLTGSRAMTGALDMETQVTLKDADGLSFEEVLTTTGKTVKGFTEAKRENLSMERFIEVHIEQGKKLEKANLAVGIVQGIAGPSWTEIIFEGKAGHAGNTPMDDRQDALTAASELFLYIEKAPAMVSTTGVATVGKVHVEPNGANVIPGKVSLITDIRDIEEQSRDQIVTNVVKKAHEIADSRNVKVAITEKMRTPPVPIGTQMTDILNRVFDDMNIEKQYLVSGAGHDAMMLGAHIPVAMIFVRSKDGVSHNPAEWTSLTDCTICAHVLKQAIEKCMEQ
ncbi:M20 family metallo-hydrolase [Paenisporosarcina quisquiliarum]|uniref:M20 family metallo-hydrolase n=1 Tax=Paenisporosarcina quisquiliarum TaxID=365346 RepID=A0A9X3RD50_9BACL|nr:M20 family metallo-hydrolase [Paenisporosarcina quisquiliarum]MCZ8536684.1 M20 family metallo-hydrolase [Paenisporosarcina quisquiliarum]